MASPTDDPDGKPALVEGKRVGITQALVDGLESTYGCSVPSLSIAR
jgi:hypothetical protein